MLMPFYVIESAGQGLMLLIIYTPLRDYLKSGLCLAPAFLTLGTSSPRGCMPDRW